jgi:hypothetical protein
MSLIKGFVQYSTIELDPAQLAIKEQVLLVTKLSRQHHLRVRFGSASRLQLCCGCCHTCISLGEWLTEEVIGYRVSFASLFSGIFCRLRSKGFQFTNAKVSSDTRKSTSKTQKIPNAGW